MSTYKVPQDVEAEDKLIGFLSLKQFLFTIIGLAFGYLTFFFLTKVHPLAAIIWLPFTIVFLVLGLYQRKDQPVEVYLASALRFYLKPRTRKWDQEGYEERVIVTAPPKIDKQYTKNFSGEEAVSRLGNLSRMMDSRGWASKLADDWQNPDLADTASSDRLIRPTALTTDLPDFAQPVDVMDENDSLVARKFQAKIQATDTTAHQQALRTMQAAREEAAHPEAFKEEPLPTHVEANPYPTMHQKTINPDSEKKAVPAQAPKPTPTQSQNSQLPSEGEVEISLR